MTVAAPYPSSTPHLLAEVRRVDLLLAVHALASAGAPPPRRATSVEERIHELLDRSAAPAPEPSAAVLAARAEADRLAASIARRAAESAARGIPLRLFQLAERFGLERADVDLLLAALAPEVPGTTAARAERPTTGAILAALLPSIEAQLAARRRLTQGAPLLRHALVRPSDDPATAHLPLAARALEVDARIAAFLFGDDAVDPRIAPYVRLSTPARSLDDLLLPAALKTRAARFLESIAASRNTLPTPSTFFTASAHRTPNAPLVSIAGPYGAGKCTLAEALCARAKCPLVTVDGAALLAAGDDAIARAAPLVVREAVLAGAAVHWAFGGVALEGAGPGSRGALQAALGGSPTLSLISGGSAWEGASSLAERPFLEVELPRPSASEQAALWASALPPHRAPDIDLPTLTSTFRFTPGQIRDAAAAAASLAHDRHRDAHAASRDRDAETASPVTMADVTAACRDLHGKRLGALARAIAPRHGWEDLVLPADRKAMLREICSHVRHRSRVLGDWAYERKLGLGKGLSALFAGPPGTGKTMAAGVIAAELGVTLLHIDLSSVVSKYIGETEKHLAALFDSAEAASAALFFDEADALFGKRTEVKDAHDRYANQETSFLLQRIESYEGVVLLATNFLKNVDEAFLRRLAFVIELPFPAAADRLRIWRGIWTPETPLDADVDLPFLAERIELSGGYIRNIALAAAFLAAEDGGPVAMRHLLHATRREFQKMGKVVDVGFFDAPR